MQSKVVAALADRSPENIAAATEGHHLVLGPGAALENEWIQAGLELPDLDAMRRWRLDRTTSQLDQLGFDAIIVMDPMNIRYVSDTTNMQLWIMHNATRYAYLGSDGYLVVWDYVNCEFFSGHNALIDEVRPATGLNYFVAGPRRAEMAQRWADEIVSLITARHGPSARVAIDQTSLEAARALETAGLTLGDGQEVMELARQIKGPDEIRAMRCSAHACQATMTDMLDALRPGMTERQVWAMLHAGNIERAGEWVETQILSSGPRTNPWMQEASSRIIEPGDMVAYDTDLVGAYGMMTDISRSWVVGSTPTPAQHDLFAIASDMLARNAELLTPGRSFYELTHQAWFPSLDDYRRYSCLFHGVGQCDEYPCIYFPGSWQDWGYDGQVQPGMCFTVESFVGARAGGEGVKLENQYLVTEHGPELLTDFALDLAALN